MHSNRWTVDWFYQTSLNQHFPDLLHTQGFLRKCFLDCFYGFRILGWIHRQIPHFPSATGSHSVHNPCGAISRPTITENGRNHRLGTSHPYPRFRDRAWRGISINEYTDNYLIITECKGDGNIRSKYHISLFITKLSYKQYMYSAFSAYIIWGENQN